jgi:hypothetical protein
MNLVDEPLQKLFITNPILIISILSMLLINMHKHVYISHCKISAHASCRPALADQLIARRGPWTCFRQKSLAEMVDLSTADALAFNLRDGCHVRAKGAWQRIKDNVVS